MLDSGAFSPRNGLMRQDMTSGRVWRLARKPLSSVVAAAAVVAMTLSAAQAQSRLSSGTGFLINEAGWILTNAHVVEDCTEIEVAGHGHTNTVIRDAVEDFAALRITNPPAAGPLVFRTRPARLAEPVHALGYPLSDILSASVRATSGTVNALPGPDRGESFLQISAPIQPGNSGGPVIDNAGLVVGVTTATLSERAYERAQNVNFALPAAAALTFLSRHGIAHQSSADAPKSSLSRDVSDQVEAAAAATLMIRCHRPAVTPQAMPPRPPPTARMIIEPGIDVIGFDYRAVRDTSLAACQRICESDPRCRAFTFNRRHGVCFLKDDAALLVRNDDALGGYSHALSSRVLHSGFSVRSDVDSPGGDYSRMRQSDFIGCFLECAGDLRCRAFAYVRATRDCWLKDRIGRVGPMPGVDFGSR